MKELRSLLMLCLLVGFIACSEKTPLEANQYLVEGKIENLEGPCIIYVPDVSMERGFRIDSIEVNEVGEFRYLGAIEDMEFLRFYPGNKNVVKATGERSYFPSRASQINFFAYPGARIRIEGTISDFVDAYALDEKKVNNTLSELHRPLMPLVNEEVNLSLERYLNPEADTAAIGRQIREIGKTQLEIKRDFYKKFPNQVSTSMYVLEDFRRNKIELEEVEKYLEKMSVKSSYLDELVKRVAAARASVTGKPAPSIQSPLTFTGDKFDLNELKGKVVVLDFWGTWCKPCIEEMPAMKEFWLTNKEKLALVGIAEERSENVWRDFLTEYDYPWVQVINGKDSLDFVTKYNVKAFPTKIVIDQAGTIVDRLVGEDEEFYERLLNKLEQI